MSSQSRLTDSKFKQLISDTPIHKKYYSHSLAVQNAIEVLVGAEFRKANAKNLLTDQSANLFYRDKHTSYLMKSLFHLSSDFELLDSNRTWLVYWSLNSLSLMKERVSASVAQSIIEYMKSCQHKDGGFAGGPGQEPHLASTYAAIHAIALLQRSDGYELIDRQKLVNWMKKLKRGNGSFSLHVDGEVDLRAVYCAMSSCDLLNLLNTDLFDKSLEWILSCQTYEGGFGASPGNEAHGGYSYCGAACLAILGKLNLCNTDRFLRWAVCRQMNFEGGFQGRTNKLVDSCYSFWVGSIFAIFHEFSNKHKIEFAGWTFDQVALQDYILFAAQCCNGGFRDKPGRQPDTYHTCYALSGLSILQHCNSDKNISEGNLMELAESHPFYNIDVESVQTIKTHFIC